MKSVEKRETKINDFIPDIVNETTKIKENLDRILKILDNLNIKKTNWSKRMCIVASKAQIVHTKYKHPTLA